MSGYIAKRKKPDLDECRELIKIMSLKNMAIHFGYSEHSFRRYLKRNEIYSPRKNGQRLGKLANEKPVWK